MLAGILDGVTGQLDKRFLLNAFFPTVVFSVALILAGAAGSDGVEPAVDAWDKLDATVKVLLTVGWFAAVIVVANILATKVLGIVRLFEGYGLPWGTRWTAKSGRNHQHAQAKRLWEEATSNDPGDAKERFQQRFPVHPRELTPADVAPTRLGNLLLSAETYSQDRYGVDAVRVWPRLYHLLPEKLLTSMAEARASMELLLVVAFLAGLYAPLAAIWLLATGAPDAWFFGSLLGGAVLSYTAYWGALAPAAIYGDHVRAAFDLNRLELLAAMRTPVPATPDEERRTWTQATRLLEYGEPVTWRYVEAPK
jgi:hypothetical protein